MWYGRWPHVVFNMCDTLTLPDLASALSCYHDAQGCCSVYFPLISTAYFHSLTHSSWKSQRQRDVGGCSLRPFNAVHSPCGPQHITPPPPNKILTAPKTHTHAPSVSLSLSLSAGSVKHSPCLASINHRFSLGIVTAGCTDIDEMSTLTTTCASLYLYLYLSDLNCLKEFMICNNDLGLLGCSGFTEKMAQLYITAG